ncbi:hypothetical protein [Halomonas urumqiensis]|uniref:Uncharacterized protein n=1 Tax=Halomonas urumqiensis TaxID=1684789 RepID=A0A2N7UF52_9GAMM|nr:hypothetical protein [Halomonas urumqiensis]PMR79098.1 hypothetical protein C1H70_12380 [Halomonas urumqiensis]PTB03772.1 hypothetical protein C6V82_04665 [Halomonas urumqiensis]GHE20001.1 hypothetical protein GCM10017767_05220 [Halomonas urumqiensis]
MARSSLTEIERRLASLESAGKDLPEIWIGPPERGLAGWECMGQNTIGSQKVHRLPGESDEELADRARECMKAMHREVPSTARAAVYFAIDHEGMSR